MRLNTAIKADPIYTHEGGLATKTDAFHELKRSVLTCLLWEDAFYEKGSSVAKRIAELVKIVKPEQVAALACEARDRMNLRHVPLFLVRELARTKGNGTLVADTLAHVIQRADEITEFLAIYWADKRQPLSAGVKRGLARAFQSFDAYRLAKYNRDDKIKLRDALFLSHARPKDAPKRPLTKAERKAGNAVLETDAERLYQRLVDGTLESPDTWEVELSAGKDKKATFERLMAEGKLGGLAVLRNLRGMLDAKVDERLIRDRLLQGCKRALPFRFIVAAKHNPKLEDSIGESMLLSVAQWPKLPGRTLLIVDTSGSMSGQLSGKSEMRRMDAAVGLAILAREICESATIYATAGDDSRRIHATMELPPRHGFALADAINQAPQKIGGGGIFFVQCLDFIASKESKPFDRVIVFTDEQDCDVKANPAAAKKLGRFNYVVNISIEKHGISYRTGWEHIDGFSEYVLDYIREYEALEASQQ